MRILLDTNIFVRLAHPAHSHHAAAVRAIEVLRARSDELCIVPQILYEFWVVATRPVADNGLGMAAEQAESELAQIKTLFRLLRDERGILPRWEQLVVDHAVQGKTAHDARLVAAMARHNTKQLLTFNAGDFARFPKITALTPDNVLQTAT